MEVKIHGIYKHFKGDYCIVEDIAKSADTLEEYVVYRELYNSQLWIRNKSEFISKVDKDKYPDVIQEYRFELQNIKSNRD